MEGTPSMSLSEDETGIKLIIIIIIIQNKFFSCSQQVILKSLKKVAETRQN